MMAYRAGIMDQDDDFLPTGPVCCSACLAKVTGRLAMDGSDATFAENLVTKAKKKKKRGKVQGSTIVESLQVCHLLVDGNDRGSVHWFFKSFTFVNIGACIRPSFRNPSGWLPRFRRSQMPTTTATTAFFNSPTHTVLNQWRKG